MSALAQDRAREPQDVDVTTEQVLPTVLLATQGCAKTRFLSLTRDQKKQSIG